MAPPRYDEEDYAYEEDASTNDEEEHSNFEHDYENWVAYYSTELHAMWAALRDKANSMNAYVLDDCSYAEFENFCYQWSSGRKPPI